MSFIVIIDIRELNGRCVAVVDDYDNITQFATPEEAADVMNGHPLVRFPWWILDLEIGETV